MLSTVPALRAAVLCALGTVAPDPKEQWMGGNS